MKGMGDGANIGSGIGEKLGALWGKKAGNSAITAVIGGAIVGSAGNRIDSLVKGKNTAIPSLGSDTSHKKKDDSLTITTATR